MTLDLDDDETAALVALLRRTLDAARYPLAPRYNVLRAILDKLDPPKPAADQLRADAPAARSVPMNAYRGPPMTLGNAAEAKVRLVVWCLDCRHQVEPDPAGQAARYGPETTVPDWRSGYVVGQYATGVFNPKIGFILQICCQQLNSVELFPSLPFSTETSIGLYEAPDFLI